MRVKLLEFTVMGVSHNLYVTNDVSDMETISEDTFRQLPCGYYSVRYTCVYLSYDLSPSAAARVFFHELYELALGTLSFTHDPYHPHDSFTTLCEILYGVIAENCRLLFQGVLADAYRSCVEKHFGASSEGELGEVCNIGVDVGAVESKTVRHFQSGGFHLFRDEIDYSLERQFPGAEPFDDAEVSAAVRIVFSEIAAIGSTPQVTMKSGLWEEDIDEGVLQVVLRRDKGEMDS